MQPLKIDIDYYSEEEKEKFKKNFPDLFKVLEENIGSIEIPLEDFKSYFLFRRQCEKNPEVFADFEKQVERLWPYFENYFEYDPNTKLFKSTKSGIDGLKEISESLGVAGALAISSKLFLGTTQADWRKIPEQQEKDFDFTHKMFIGKKQLVVESKGAVTEDNTNPSAVSYHKKNILNKKEDKSFIGKYETQTHTCYGVISVADPTHGLKSWLVDPPFETSSSDSDKSRLLSRLYFYNDYLRLISIRSYMSLLLPNRIKTISTTSSHSDLDKLPLLDSKFIKIRIRDSFVNSRSRIIRRSQDKIVGHLSVTSDNHLMFLGLNVELLRLLINQNFEDILKYRVTPSTENLEVNCRLPKSTNRKVVKMLEEKKYQEENGYYNFRLNFIIQKNSAGVYFGKSSLENLK